MSNGEKTGLAGAMDLDQAAKDLQNPSVAVCGGGVEKPPLAGGGVGSGVVSDDEQLRADFAEDLFHGEATFGAMRRPKKPKGAGRPKGSLGLKTSQLVKLIESVGGNPLMAMARIVVTPIDEIAKTLGCSKIKAAEYHRKVMSDLAPYVAQKQPIAIAVQGGNAGMLTVIDMSTMGQASGGGSEFGLGMKVINQGEKPNEIKGGAGQSYEGQSHDEEKASEAKDIAE